MFRDSHGVVHTVCSADPLADLPPAAATALQSALLLPGGPEGGVDLGSVLERCDAVRELLDRWQDAFFAGLPVDVDLEEEQRWAAEAGLSLDELEAGYEDEEDEEELDPDVYPGPDDLDDDELQVLLATPVPDDDPRRLLPEELVSILERELLLLPVRVRLEALIAASDLVEQWSDLVADREKLLGHLVLAHDVVPGPQERSHEQLATCHAASHDADGPDHRSSP